MAAPAVERRTVRAQVRHVRVSPYKVREVLGLIRGKPVGEAEEALVLTERDPAQIVVKCLASAMANAEHNDQIDSSELFVAECYCDEGPTLKRWRPRARGRATRIRKRTSHITIILGRYTPDELQAMEDREALKGTGGRRRDAGEDRRRRVAKSRGDEVEETTDEPLEEDADTAVATDEADTDAAAEETAAEDTSADDAVTEAVEETEASEDATEADADSGDAPSADELVAGNTKDELVALAEKAGADVAKSANKAAIAEAIVAAGDGADEGDA
jgi:large subunit ribosomal protein L22